MYMLFEQNSKKNFILLVTGSEDNDAAAKRAADTALDTINCKLSYVPPYESFEDIKTLQLRLFDSPYIKGRNICCVLDISEWIGHENEEYFAVLLKYFHDHRSRLEYIFTVGCCSEDDAKQLYFRLRCYLRGSIATDLTFIKTGSLCGYIESKNIARKAARVLAEMIMSEEMKPMRSYPTIDMMCDELREYSGCGTDMISPAAVREYLLDCDSLPAVVNSGCAAAFADRIQKLPGRLGDIQDRIA